MAEGESNPSGTDHAPMDQFTAHIDRGWDLVHRGDLRGALVSAEKSVELDAQSPEAHNLLGFVKAAQGQAEDALEHYKQAIALDDTFVEAMLNAAEVLIHPLHDFAAAIGMVEEALDFAENDDEVADALLLKYDAFTHQSDKENAGRVALRMPKGPFESPRLDFLVGRAHFECGSKEEAERLLTSAVTRAPADADAHYTLALVYEASGNSRAMVASFLNARAADLAFPAMPWTQERGAFESLVRATIERLAPPLRAALGDAEIILAEAPGAEVVADGIDPRSGVLLDTPARSGERSPEASVTRVFVYQRNVERAAEDVEDLSDELLYVLEDELCALFPELAVHATKPERNDEHDH
jgi:tetratricopeptide (TPR) repeat protein